MNKFVVLATLGLIGCGTAADKSTDPVPTPEVVAVTVKVDSTKTKVTGDFVFSPSVSLDAGKLSFTIPAIVDPEDPSKPIDPSKVLFTVVGKDSKDLRCSVSTDTTKTKPMVDLVFVTDTTGSMSGTLNGVTKSIQAFVDSVAAEGVDMKLGLVAYGDLFAVKHAGSTLGGTAPLGTGDGSDSDRPFLDLTNVATFKALNASLYATGGGDSPENTLGATKYAFDKITWRVGAAKVLFVTGDNTAHLPGDSATPGVWNPPASADLISSLKGNATVHTIGPDYKDSYYYDFSLLADATGGKKFPLSNPDLTSIHFADWFVNSYKGTCDGISAGTYDIVITATIKGITKSWTAAVTLNVEAVK
jgi:hypothetical protein